MLKICGLDLSINGSGCVKFEVDDDLNIIKKDYMAFTQIKKYSTDKIFYYKKKDYRNKFDQNLHFKHRICSFCQDADIIAIEGYAYGSAAGLIFDIAEFGSLIKYSLYQSLKKIRIYDICSIKMFGAGAGNAQKQDMVDSYYKLKNEDMFDWNFLNKYDSPHTDLVDAFWIAQLLLVELRLRKGFVKLRDLTEKQIQIFNRTSKYFPNNILDTDFIEIV
jgi:hypothetical protein